MALTILVSFLCSCTSDSMGTPENVIDRFVFDTVTFHELDTDSQLDLGITVQGTISSPVTVSYQIKEAQAKFDRDLLPGSGTLTFGPDRQEASLSLVIIGDDDLEISERFVVELRYNGKSIPYYLTIVDDDEPGDIQTDQDGYITPKEYPSMQAVWSDEFESSSLDLDNWSYEIGNGCDQGICGWGNNELQNYTDNEENITIRGGRLVITAREEGGYSSARIKTQDKVEIQYGRIDIRARLPEGQGIWPALWMLGGNIDNVGWPACGEIDIMELVGHEPSVVHGTVHYDNNGYKTSSGSRSISQGTYSDRFHVFTIVWDRDMITWYVDNELFKTFTFSGITNKPFNAPFYFLFNVAIGGRWPGNPDASTPFPQEMVVDYIRVFQ